MLLTFSILAIFLALELGLKHILVGLEVVLGEKPDAVRCRCSREAHKRVHKLTRGCDNITDISYVWRFSAKMLINYNISACLNHCALYIAISQLWELMPSVKVRYKCRRVLRVVLRYQHSFIVIFSCFTVSAAT